MMHGFGFGGFGTFGLIGWILNLVISIGLIVGIVLFVVWLVKRVNTGGSSFAAPARSGQPSPQEILKMRYAQGEITREQYQQMLEDLKE